MLPKNAVGNCAPDHRLRLVALQCPSPVAEGQGAEVNDVRPWLVLLALLAAAGVAWRWGRQAQRCGRVPAGPGARGPRRWHPRTPDDCPACRAQPPASPP